MRLPRLLVSLCHPLSPLSPLSPFVSLCLPLSLFMWAALPGCFASRLPLSPFVSLCLPLSPFVSLCLSSRERLCRVALLLASPCLPLSPFVSRRLYCFFDVPLTVWGLRWCNLGFFGKASKKDVGLQHQSCRACVGVCCVGQCWVLKYLLMQSNNIYTTGCPSTH